MKDALSATLQPQPRSVRCQRSARLVTLALAVASAPVLVGADGVPPLAAFGAASSAPPHPTASRSQKRVSVWVELSAPPVAAPPQVDADGRRRRLDAVKAQQAALIDALAALDAIETGRVQLSRNAVAVDAPAQALEALSRLPGVVAVRPLVHRNSIR